MYRPFPMFVGLRYVRARRQRYFVSFIGWVSLLGVALGVAALIVVLSVMNGFQAETRLRLLSLGAHAHVQLPATPSIAAADALATTLESSEGVRGAEPYLELQALAIRAPELLPLSLRGIDPARDGRVVQVAPQLRTGSLDELVAGGQRILLGNELAARLGVALGDELDVMAPTIGAGGVPEPRLRRFTVAGLFSAGISDHDSVLGLVHLADARALAPELAGALGVRLRFVDELRVGEFLPALRAHLPHGAILRTWIDDHAGYLRAVRIEKAMMALILLLVVAVAAFSIVAMLVMVVNEKRTDIAILRTQGATPAQIAAVFLTQGLAIGWLGVALGLALGVWVARNAGALMGWLESTLNFSLFDPSVYYISALPSELQWPQVVWVAVAALLLTLLATLYPAQRAARTSPAEALRYE